MSSSPPTVRVCQIISSFHPVVGGAEQATLHLSRELVRRGAAVSVLTRRYAGLGPRDSLGGVRVYRAGLPLRGKAGALFFALHALLLLATRLRDHRVVHAQGPDVQLLVSLIARVLLGRRVVFTVHSDPHLQLRIGASGGGPRFRAVRRWADRIGVLGPHVARTLEAAGIPGERIIQLPNGVDTGRFAPPDPAERAALRKDVGLLENEVAGAFVGRLVALKRVDLLIRAWVESGAAETGPLLVVGEGPEEEGLRRLAADVAPSSVRFLGRMDTPETVLKAADLFILPSQREGQSVALLEAMACGLVPVVSDLEPNTAVVDEGVTGFVFTTDDGASLASALRRALESDRPGIAQRAASQVAARNSLDVTAATHLSLYQRLMVGASPHAVPGRIL
ncbi:MAG: glycosyltransferase family 4 protein [Gemmatimonadota bacterium]|nr:glycosyltransferase family 4 protein [Gemmatimonadota bacterium]